MPLRHLLIAIAVVAVWGSNFVVIKLGLAHLPPLLFAALRFSLALVPAMFFLPRPRVPTPRLAAYGISIGAGQFGLLYIAMNGHISPGLASLVVQTQVFFTIAMAAYFSGERPRGFQGVAVLLAASGLAVVALHVDATTSLLGLALVLGAALSWSVGNIITKSIGSVNMLSFVVWSSAFPVPVLLGMSFALEGWDAIRTGITHADAATWAAVAWQAWGNTLFGYAAWSWLLARHTAASVVPMALLVPVFGMASSAWWLGEPLPAWKLQAAALVIGGLAINMFWPALRQRFARGRAPGRAAEGAPRR